jgi:hypothetical protein
MDSQNGESDWTAHVAVRQTDLAQKFPKAFPVESVLEAFFFEAENIKEASHCCCRLRAPTHRCPGRFQDGDWVGHGRQSGLGRATSPPCAIAEVECHALSDQGPPPNVGRVSNATGRGSKNEREDATVETNRNGLLLPTAVAPQVKEKNVPEKTHKKRRENTADREKCMQCPLLGENLENARRSVRSWARNPTKRTFEVELHSYFLGEGHHLHCERRSRVVSGQVAPRCWFGPDAPLQFLGPGFSIFELSCLGTFFSKWQPSFDQVSMACWQKGLEIMVRIGYMHNAAHPQSLHPVRAARRSSSFQAVPAAYLAVLPPDPHTCHPSPWTSHSPLCPASIHRTGLSTKPSGAAEPAGDSAVQASMGQAVPEGVWGRGNRATHPLRPVPSLACHPRCLSWSLGAVHALSALLFLGSCLPSPVGVFCVCLLQSQDTTLCSFGPVSRSLFLPTHPIGLEGRCCCPPASCTSIIYPPSTLQTSRLYIRTVQPWRAPRQCCHQVHTCCVLLDLCSILRPEPPPHASQLGHLLHKNGHGPGQWRGPNQRHNTHMLAGTAVVPKHSCRMINCSGRVSERL